MAGDPARAGLLGRATRLEYLTVGWNVVEGVVAVSAAAAAGSVALLGFGLDSFVESTSGLILLWRLSRERVNRHTSSQDIERLDHRAHRLVGVTLFLLAAYCGAVDLSTPSLEVWAQDRVYYRLRHRPRIGPGHDFINLTLQGLPPLGSTVEVRHHHESRSR